MHLATPDSEQLAAASVVEVFLRNLLERQLREAATMVTGDMVFLGRRGWRGEGSPFRPDARMLDGSVRVLLPSEVASLPESAQREAFEVPISDGEQVLFAILKTPTSRATLGIIARREGESFRIARLFDTKRVKQVLASVH